MPPKKLTVEELYRVEQLRLRIDWIQQGFEVQIKDNSEGVEAWDDCNPQWAENRTYRRKPLPKYIPWTREDAGLWRGIWVRIKSNKIEAVIERFCPSDDTVFLANGWLTFEKLLEACTQLDGTPCGKFSP